MRGLIGNTGFVGSTLLRAAAFDRLYNSTNVHELAGQSFDLLVCAGVSAVKWQANQNPEADQAGIGRLTQALGRAHADELILISTVDVYPDPAHGADEATPIDPAANHAYGRHRLALESWCRTRFPLVRILRLPALFGQGLRKNALYDLIHGHRVEAINPSATFQWYPLDRLWPDIATIRTAGLDLVNLVPEPLPMRAIIDTVFPGAPVGPPLEPAPRYALATRHAAQFGESGPWIMPAARSLAAIARFASRPVTL